MGQLRQAVIIGVCSGLALDAMIYMGVKSMNESNLNPELRLSAFDEPVLSHSRPTLEERHSCQITPTLHTYCLESASVIDIYGSLKTDEMPPFYESNRLSEK